MPELPEVEVIRKGIAPLIANRTIASIEVLHPRCVRRHEAGPADFEAVSVGHKVTGASRRGKYLWLTTESGDALVTHLGMSGQFRWGKFDELPRNTRAVVSFTDTDDQLIFVDQRMFGGLHWSIGGAALPSEVAHIARDPFDPEFDLAEVSKKIQAKRSVIKRALLDQTVVSGIGNIYADESLWRARVNGNQPTQSLSGRKIREVLRAAQDVMAESLEQGGTSFDELYINVNGESGYFSRSLNAYGREGEPCTRCGKPIAREHFMNRSSFYCTHCQKVRK